MMPGQTPDHASTRRTGRSGLSNLISTATLEAELGSSQLVVFDASWHLPVASQPARDARAEYLLGHIPSARFVDIDAISDQHTNLPHMLASPAEFQASMRTLGLNRQSDVVVYDTSGLLSAPRLWWMLKACGHEQVRVLDGGLPKWRAEGRPLARGEFTCSPGDFEASPELFGVASLEATRSASLVLDARSAQRFHAQAPEPRPGIPSGHMPNARNLPFDRLLRDGQLRSRAELEAEFEMLGVHEDTPVVTSCGSGMTAAIISLALAEIGHTAHALYDGSWTEYAQRCPEDVITGEAALPNRQFDRATRGEFTGNP